MRCLLLADIDLFQPAGKVKMIRHCQGSTYYQELLSGTSDGTTEMFSKRSKPKDPKAKAVAKKKLMSDMDPICLDMAEATAIEDIQATVDSPLHQADLDVSLLPLVSDQPGQVKCKEHIEITEQDFEEMLGPSPAESSGSEFAFSWLEEDVEVPGYSTATLEPDLEPGTPRLSPLADLSPGTPSMFEPSSPIVEASPAAGMCPGPTPMFQPSSPMLEASPVADLPASPGNALLADDDSATHDKSITMRIVHATSEFIFIIAIDDCVLQSCQILTCFLPSYQFSAHKHSGFRLQRQTSTWGMFKIIASGRPGSLK